MTTPTPAEPDAARRLRLAGNGFVRLAGVFERIEAHARGDRHLIGLAQVGRYLAVDMATITRLWSEEAEGPTP